MLYQRPQADMAGTNGLKAFLFSVSVFTFRQVVLFTLVLFDFFLFILTWHQLDKKNTLYHVCCINKVNSTNSTDYFTSPRGQLALQSALSIATNNTKYGSDLLTAFYTPAKQKLKLQHPIFSFALITCLSCDLYRWFRAWTLSIIPTCPPAELLAALNGVTISPLHIFLLPSVSIGLGWGIYLALFSCSSFLTCYENYLHLASWLYILLIKIA